MTAPVRGGAERAKRLLDEAAGIIEVGDQRLLAYDGPAGNLPPDISLAEWRRLYVCIQDARKALGMPRQCTAGLGKKGGRCPNPATTQYRVKYVRSKPFWLDRCDDHAHPTAQGRRLISSTLVGERVVGDPK